MNLKHFLKQWALKNDHRLVGAGDASKCVPISCVLPPTTSTHLGDLSLAAKRDFWSTSSVRPTIGRLLFLKVLGDPEILDIATVQHCEHFWYQKWPFLSISVNWKIFLHFIHICGSILQKSAHCFRKC